MDLNDLKYRYKYRTNVQMEDENEEMKQNFTHSYIPTYCYLHRLWWQSAPSSQGVDCPAWKQESDTWLDQKLVKKTYIFSLVCSNTKTSFFGYCRVGESEGVYFFSLTCWPVVPLLPYLDSSWDHVCGRSEEESHYSHTTTNPFHILNNLSREKLMELWLQLWAKSMLCLQNIFSLMLVNATISRSCDTAKLHENVAWETENKMSIRCRVE